MNVGNSLCFRVVGAQKPNLQVGGRSLDDRALPLWKRRPPVGRPRDYGLCKPSFSLCAASPRPLGSSPKSPRSPLQGEPRFAAGRDRLAPGNAGRFRPGSGGGRRSSPSSPGCYCPKQQKTCEFLHENAAILERKTSSTRWYGFLAFSCPFSVSGSCSPFPRRGAETLDDTVVPLGDFREISKISQQKREPFGSSCRGRGTLSDEPLPTC